VNPQRLSLRVKLVYFDCLKYIGMTIFKHRLGGWIENDDGIVVEWF